MRLVRRFKFTGLPALEKSAGRNRTYDPAFARYTTVRKSRGYQQPQRRNNYSVAILFAGELYAMTPETRGAVLVSR